ncbi:hypothetical protein, conserved [Eimeria brunetti]|uniref:CH-like domain-containing protein n=1 Tax=Eimeria brunetti TaxID=51314 RepID=U6LTM5_9EIME|nr:hypothetical protein, conserved [Eimeria brunetti]
MRPQQQRTLQQQQQAPPPQPQQQQQQQQKGKKQQQFSKQQEKQPQKGFSFVCLLMAEVANHCIPRIADLHNYSTANSFQQKRYNWETLSERVFKRVGLKLTAAEIDSVVAARPGAAESIILRFKQRAEALKQQSAREAEGSPKGTQLTRCAPQPPPRPKTQQEWGALLDAKIELLTKALQAAAAPPPQ